MSKFNNLFKQMVSEKFVSQEYKYKPVQRIRMSTIEQRCVEDALHDFMQRHQRSGQPIAKCCDAAWEFVEKIGNVVEVSSRELNDVEDALHEFLKHHERSGEKVAKECSDVVWDFLEKIGPLKRKLSMSEGVEHEEDFYRGGDNSIVTTNRDIHAPDFTIPKGTEIKVLNKTELTHYNDLLVWFVVMNCPSDESLNGEASNILVSELF